MLSKGEISSFLSSLYDSVQLQTTNEKYSMYISPRELSKKIRLIIKFYNSKNNIIYIYSVTKLKISVYDKT